MHGSPSEAECNIQIPEGQGRLTSTTRRNPDQALPAQARKAIKPRRDSGSVICGMISGMGISYLGARMMWNAQQSGVCFDRVLTLGHLSLRLYPSEVAFFRRAYRQAFGTTAVPLCNYQWGEFVDRFLCEFLGANSISVLDASEYQGADTIHDMNFPVPEALHGIYDAVIDGGTLEHIFNVPTAFTNVAKMLKVGGTVFVNTPANNMMGHGFYQFSPEFMFRVFSEVNGFSLRNVLLYEGRYPGVELTKKATLYRVTDPDDIRQRVGLQNKYPVMMMVEAKKIRHAEIFSNPPLQSDYVARWSPSGASDRISVLRQIVKHSIRALPVALRGPIVGYRQKRNYSLHNGRLYTRQRWTP